MSAAVDVLSWICIVAGAVFCVIGTLGLVRMPDFYTRVHAAGIVDTAGAGFLLFGLILQAGLTLIAVKLVMVGLLLLFTSPTATHALLKAAMARGVKPLLASGDEQSKP